MPATARAIVLLALMCPAGGCAPANRIGGSIASPQTDAPAAAQSTGTGLRGSLLLVGGGLDRDNTVVYERFMQLARRAAGDARVRLVIVTAASGNQAEAARRQSDVLRLYCEDAFIDVVQRETSPQQTRALIDAAHGLFFTGGDQKRITDRYLAGGRDTSEASAMRRLLLRGGVIAGNSAGDAMMSDPMFLSGRSAAALGIRTDPPRRPPPGAVAAASTDRPVESEAQSAATMPTAEGDERPERSDPPLGPQIGPGMGFLPWAMADSHFFERDRFGRLVAALETSGRRLGIGVGEAACVEIDLTTGEAIGVTTADSLLVDVGGLQRSGLSRRNIRTQLIEQGMRVPLLDRPTHALVAAPPTPERIEDVAREATSQDRRRASWRFFRDAQRLDHAARRLQLDGYQQIGWSAGSQAVVELRPD